VRARDAHRYSWLGLAVTPIALLIATPAAAEHIIAYWRLEASAESGLAKIGFSAPFLTQRILPVKLAKLREAALPAGSTEPVPAGSLLYLVSNDSGKIGYCTLKNRKGAAKSLFIPALDKRPCFVDGDGDGRFDGSFSVFDIYSKLSPPQPRGSINGAETIAQPAAFEQVDVHSFPDQMTLAYRLVGGRGTLGKVKLEVTLDRPGHRDWVEVKGFDAPQGRLIAALGTVVLLKSIDDAGVEVEMRIPSLAYVRGQVNGIVFEPALPAYMR
jgi:hypothetical protein